MCVRGAHVTEQGGGGGPCARGRGERSTAERSRREEDGGTAASGSAMGRGGEWTREQRRGQCGELWMGAGRLAARQRRGGQNGVRAGRAQAGRARQHTGHACASVGLWMMDRGWRDGRLHKVQET